MKENYAPDLSESRITAFERTIWGIVHPDAGLRGEKMYEIGLAGLFVVMKDKSEP